MAESVSRRDVESFYRDPFEVVRSLATWDPWRQVERFDQRLVPSAARAFVPRLDVSETADSYIFEADLPGTKEGDIEITITGNCLTISGTRVEEERRDDDRYYAMERAFGTFTRTFTLPEDADLDRIEARLDGGVLTVKAQANPSRGFEEDR